MRDKMQKSSVNTGSLPLAWYTGYLPLVNHIRKLIHTKAPVLKCVCWLLYWYPITFVKGLKKWSFGWIPHCSILATWKHTSNTRVQYRLLDSLVVKCWLRVREVPGSILSQGPRHTKDVIKMVPVVPLFSTEHSKGKLLSLSQELR